MGKTVCVSLRLMWLCGCHHCTRLLQAVRKTGRMRIYTKSYNCYWRHRHKQTKQKKFKQEQTKQPELKPPNYDMIWGEKEVFWLPDPPPISIPVCHTLCPQPPSPLCPHPYPTNSLPQLAGGSSSIAFVSKHEEGINWLQHLALSTRLPLCVCHLALSPALLPPLSPPLTFIVTASSCICFLLLLLSDPVDPRPLHSSIMNEEKLNECKHDTHNHINIFECSISVCFKTTAFNITHACLAKTYRPCCLSFWWKKIMLCAYASACQIN